MYVGRLGTIHSVHVCAWWGQSHIWFIYAHLALPWLSFSLADLFLPLLDFLSCSGALRVAEWVVAAKWAEGKSPVITIHLSTISSPILEKVIQYFYYKKRWDGVAKRPKFEIPLESVTQVLMAANFLDT
jgi:hypothetical protein